MLEYESDVDSRGNKPIKRLLRKKQVRGSKSKLCSPARLTRAPANPVTVLVPKEQPGINNCASHTVIIHDKKPVIGQKCPKRGVATQISCARDYFRLGKAVMNLHVDIQV
uniref:Uncharacterized protein n=1 Tax=Pristionchus pacificus TaxID=54126 RepID=A0A2A6BQN9_PRIPA|eukprot:PDM68103.1 hypothetical protein PRIPAC_46147 [Pristionchus pacificus]